MKHTYLSFGTGTARPGALPKLTMKRFPGADRFGSSAYKTDAEVEAEKKAAKEEGERIVKEIGVKETALKALEMKTPDDLTKSITLMKEIAELKGKNVDQKIAALETALAEAKAMKPEVTAQQLKDVADQLAVTVKALDMVQTQAFVKSTKTAAKKSFKEILSEEVDKKGDDFGKLHRGEIKELRIELKAVTDVSTVNVDGTTVWGAIYRPGMIMLPNQIGHIRNAIGVQNAGPGTDYYFMKEVIGEGAPAPTAEKKDADATTVGTGLKPRFSVKWKEDKVPFETIAGIMPISRKAINNIPGITSFLSSRVPELLLDVEDSQILYGDAASPNIKGILTAGNYVASTSVALVLPEKVIDDIILLEDTHKRQAASIWMRPNAYQSFFKNKAAGSGEYDLPRNVDFVNGVLYISGIPVFKTTALTTGDYVVAAAMGAEMQVQENINMRFFEQNRDNVETNQLTLRVEETVALPVFGSNYFIKGAVPA